MKVSHTLLMAAVGGILVGVTGTGCGGNNANPDPAVGTPPAASGAPAAPAAKHACKGQNDCKGQGGCKS
jgi:hypothetical protein